MLLRFVHFIFCITLFCIGCSTSKTKVEHQLHWVEEVVHSFDSLGGFNGAIGVIAPKQNLDSIWFFGVENFVDSTPIHAKSSFYLASVTKPFLGLRTLQLLENGTLKPNDTIGKWLPELKPALQKVSLTHLMNHQSGIHDFYSLTDNHKDLNNAAALQLLTQLDSTVYKPGTRYGYTNSGYVLLAEILERVEKTDLVVQLNKHVFSPLGEPNIGFYHQGAGPIQGHESNNEPVEFKSNTYGDGGMVANASQIRKLLKGLTASAEMKHLLMRGKELSDFYTPDSSWTYGYGWFFTSDSTGTFAAHSGKANGYRAQIRWNYEDHSAFFLLSNRWDSYINAISRNVTAAMSKKRKNHMR